MASPRTSRVRLTKEDRRARVLAVATNLVGTKGFNNLSLKELAQECGISDAGVLHHFGSKEGLLLELLRERDREDERVLAQEFPGQQLSETRSVEAILAVLRAIVVNNVARPEFVRLFAVLRAEAFVKNHSAHDYFARRDAATLDLFTKLVAPVVPDALATARQVVAAMNGLESQWLLEDLAFDLAAEWDKVAAKLIR